MFGKIWTWRRKAPTGRFSSSPGQRPGSRRIMLLSPERARSKAGAGRTIQARQSPLPTHENRSPKARPDLESRPGPLEAPQGKYVFDVRRHGGNRGIQCPKGAREHSLGLSNALPWGETTQKTINRPERAEETFPLHTRLPELHERQCLSLNSLQPASSGLRRSLRPGLPGLVNQPRVSRLARFNGLTPSWAFAR